MVLSTKIIHLGMVENQIDFKNALIIAVVIVLIYFVYVKVFNDSEHMKVQATDGHTYNILEDYEDKKETAELFSRINRKMLMFLEALKKKYGVNAVGFDGYSTHPQNELIGIVDRVLSNYNFEALFETEPTGKSGTSYTVEKGEELHMCMRDKKTLKLHNEHEIMFVALHELAHMGNLGWGHGTDFWEVFKFILHEANELGIHRPVNYKYTPIYYCGLKVDYNPYFDPEVNSIWK